jgi:hypothetical protein
MCISLDCDLHCAQWFFGKQMTESRAWVGLILLGKTEVCLYGKNPFLVPLCHRQHKEYLD